jgi:hypothetical protein
MSGAKIIVINRVARFARLIHSFASKRIAFYDVCHRRKRCPGDADARRDRAQS